MRKLKVVISGGAVPTLAATMLAPMADGCGSPASPSSDASMVSGADASFAAPEEASASGPEASTPIVPADATVAPTALCPAGYCSTIVPLPEAGTPADPGQLCALSTTPVSSNDAARVTLKATAPTAAMGFVALPVSIANFEFGPPVITVVSATSPELAKMSVTPASQLSSGGFTFMATWPGPLPMTAQPPQSMMVKASFLISCGDAGTRTVESVTQIFRCVDGSSFGWASSGDPCTVCCQVIAEMAPSPIVSDNAGDDLPLARALRLRVVEIARTESQVLLLAENDAGAGAGYEWRVTGGTVERLADDVILWSLPEGIDAPFGQVAVWSDVGAAVENFVWTQTGAAA